MNRQKVFNKVWDHFIVKRGRFSVDSLGNCLYRLDRTPSCKTRCGVGVIIPDGEYTPNLENQNPLNETFNKIAKKLGWTKTDRQWLTSLQETHDTSACNGNDRKEFKQRLKSLAKSSRLTVPKNR